MEKRPQNKNNDQSKNVDRVENLPKTSDSYLRKQSVQKKYLSKDVRYLSVLDQNEVC